MTTDNKNIYISPTLGIGAKPVDNSTLNKDGTLDPMIASSTYYNNNATFDITDFNKKFDDYLDQERAKRVLTEQKFLEAKDFEVKEKKLHEYTFIELVINMKNAIFDILDDIASLNITIETFTKDNRLFYTGLLMIIFAVTLVCVNIIFK